MVLQSKHIRSMVAAMVEQAQQLLEDAKDDQEQTDALLLKSALLRLLVDVRKEAQG